MKDIRLAAILAAPIILAVLLAVAASDPYTGYPEGTRPTPNQDGNRSLSKINSLLYGTNGTGLKVQGTFSATTSTNVESTLTDGTNGIVGVTADHKLMVDASFTGTFDTNVVAVLTDRTNIAFIDPTTGGLRVLVMNDTTTNITVTNLWGITTVDSSNPLPITGLVGSTNASQAKIGATNDPSTALYLQPSTNQVSFCMGATNVANNITNAGVVGYVAWVSTNAGFRVPGGSGLLQSIQIASPTNRDVVLWVFNKVITAPTVGTMWTPTIDDLQYCKGNWATTNSAFGDWQLAGTNYVKTMGGLAMPMRNGDSSVNLMVIATHLDTKSNYTANATYTRVGMINDQ